MHMKRLASAACALVLCVLVCLGTVGCKSDKDKVVDLVTHTMESYSVAADDQADAKSNKDAVEPTYGDDVTMTQLTAYGVRDFEYHEHCFKNYSFEVGDATVDGDSASVSVTVTNQSLSAAADAAASDYKAWAETEESQQAYAESGRQALVDKLVELLYARLDANESPVTTTVAVDGSPLDAVVSVRTAGDVPREKVTDVVRALSGVRLTSPVHMGDLVLADVCGTGVNVVATREA